MKIVLGDGWEDVDGAFSQVKKMAEGEELLDILEAGANVAYTIAYDLVPVDTGLLQSTLEVVRDTDNVSLGANTDYAEDVEFGTPRMAAQPYLRPAMAHKEEILDAMAEELQKKQSEVSK